MKIKTSFSENLCPHWYDDYDDSLTNDSDLKKAKGIRGIYGGGKRLSIFYAIRFGLYTFLAEKKSNKTLYGTKDELLIDLGRSDATEFMVKHKYTTSFTFDPPDAELLLKICQFYQQRIRIYRLVDKTDGCRRLLDLHPNLDARRIGSKTKKIMHLLFAADQFYFITDHDLLQKLFRCDFCGRIFISSRNVSRHRQDFCRHYLQWLIMGADPSRKCSLRRTEHVWEISEPGPIRIRPTIYTYLTNVLGLTQDELGGHAPALLQRNKFVIFDLESWSPTIRYTREKVFGLILENEQNLLSIVATSNLTGFETAKHFVIDPLQNYEKTASDTCQNFVKYLLLMANEWETYKKRQLKPYYELVMSLKMEYMEAGNARWKHCDTALMKMNAFCKQLVVLGFNSAGYDMVLLR